MRYIEIYKTVFFFILKQVMNLIGHKKTYHIVLPYQDC